MAFSEKYTCKNCGFSIEAWDEGNPYISTRCGRRHYFYHPGSIEDLRPTLAEEAGHELDNEEFEKTVTERAGNASDHLCPDCGRVSKLDPAKDQIVCANCGSNRLFETWRCQGKPCPKCGGRFSAGEFNSIS